MTPAAHARPAARNPEATHSAAPVMLGRAAGGAATLLGLTVLVGWHTHTVPLLRIQPAFVAMAYNTALGFFLSGLGPLAALACAPRAAYAARACGLTVALLGLLTLSEYLGGWNLRLGELLMRAYIRSGVTAPAWSLV